MGNEYGQPDINFHHPVFDRAKHNADKNGAEIRKRILVPMYVAAHRLLHAECPTVPVPNQHALRRVARDFNPHHKASPVSKINQLADLYLLEAEHPRTHEIESGVLQLAAKSIRLQIPYIEDGMPDEYKGKATYL